MEFEKMVQICMRKLEEDVPNNISDVEAIMMIGEMFVNCGPEAIKEAIHRLEMGR